MVRLLIHLLKQWRKIKKAVNCQSDYSRLYVIIFLLILNNDCSNLRIKKIGKKLNER